MSVVAQKSSKNLFKKFERFQNDQRLVAGLKLVDQFLVGNQSSESSKQPTTDFLARSKNEDLEFLMNNLDSNKDNVDKILPKLEMLAKDNNLNVKKHDDKVKDEDESINSKKSIESSEANFLFSSLKAKSLGISEEYRFAVVIFIFIVLFFYSLKLSTNIQNIFFHLKSSNLLSGILKIYFMLLFIFYFRL